VAHGLEIAEQGEEVWNWSSPAGRARMDRRVDLFTDSLGLDGARKRVLELGCGTGLYTERLAARCGSLVAVDISDALLTRARARVTVPHVRFLVQDLEAIQPEQLGGPFDAVYGCSVLHHLDLDVTLPQLRAILAPGAQMAFSEPNLLNPQVQLMFSRFAWARRRWATSDTEMAFYPWELRRIFVRHGFQVAQLFPFDFMHPAVPAASVPWARAADQFLERMPLVRSLGGSCFVHVRVP
jgi:SAM-dependent methyltransferase